MPKFDLKRISAVCGVQGFYQLTIDDDPNYDGANTEEEQNERKTGQLDVFENNLESRYSKDIRMIYAYMDQVANNKVLPGKKFHELNRPSNDPIKEYEFKHGDLRIYAFKIPNGKIIVMGGFKKNQKKDIERFRSLKQQYLDSIK